MMFFPSFGGGIEMKGGDGAAGGGVHDNDDHQQQRPKGGFVATEQQLQEQQPKAECYSDEVDSRSSDGGGAESEQPHVRKRRKSSSSVAAVPVQVTSGGDGATVEVVRRPRGRPPGSKNKPKPPVVITRDADDPSSPAAMRPHVIEIPAGEDVVDALARFCRRRGLGLSVLAGTGLVSNVVLRPNLSFQGHFEILSISATFFPPPLAPSPPLALSAAGGGGFSVMLAGPRGQVFGGLVAGPLTVARSVIILAATFCNPTYHRLPAEDSVSVSGGGDVETARGLSTQAQSQPRQQHNASSRQHQQRQQPPHQQQQQERSASPPSSDSPATAAAAAQHHNHHHHLQPAAAVAVPAAAESCGMSIYGGQLPSDVIWTPAARSPPY